MKPDFDMTWSPINLLIRLRFIRAIAGIWVRSAAIKRGITEF